MQQEPQTEADQVTTKGDDVAVKPSYFSARTHWLGKIAIDRAQDFREFLHRDMNVPRITSSPEKHNAKKAERLENINQLKLMVNQSKQVVARVSSVFPVALFPDDVILDRTKVTIIQRQFFWTARTISVRIEDVLNVSCSVGPFFGSVIISMRIMNSVDHFEVDRLCRRDAADMKRLIQGYMIAKHSHVELDHLTVPELVETLHELGDDSSTK